MGGSRLDRAEHRKVQTKGRGVRQFRGVVNALGWSTVAIYFLLALGFWVFALRKPAAAA